MGAVDRAVRFWTTAFFKDLHGLLANSSVYIFDDSKLLQCGGVKESSFTASGLQLMFDTLWKKTVVLLRIERPASLPPKANLLDENESAVRPSCCKFGSELLSGSATRLFSAEVKIQRLN